MGAYFELLWYHGINAPGLFSFEGNLVHVIRDRKQVQSEETTRIFHSEVLMLILTQNLLSVKKKEAQYIVNQ